MTFCAKLDDAKSVRPMNGKKTAGGLWLGGRWTCELEIGSGFHGRGQGLLALSWRYASGKRIAWSLDLEIGGDEDEVIRWCSPN